MGDCNGMAGTRTNLHIHLRAWRNSLGMTQEHVAARIGSRNNTLSGWETGERKVDLDDLKKLAEVYGTHPAALLFAPPGGAQFDNMRRAERVLASLDPEGTELWLQSGRKMGAAYISPSTDAQDNVEKASTKSPKAVKKR